MIYIAGQPHVLLGGANSEALDNAAVLRAADIPVTLVHYSNPHPALVETAKSLGIEVKPYQSGMFANQIVAGWCHPRFLESITSPRPRCAVWFNCMTQTSKIERFVHQNGAIDRFGFVSAYQKRIIVDELSKVAPIKEFSGYAPPFTTAWRAFKGAPRRMGSTIGVITRDDPAKVNRRVFEIYQKSQAKRLIWLGWGNACSQSYPDVSEIRGFSPVSPTTVGVSDFYDQIDVCLHIPGDAGESFCRIMMEAAEADVPFLATHSHAFPEFINGACAGQLCREDREFVAMINQILASNDCARSMASAQKRHLRSQQFNERCLGAWRQLLAECK